MIGGSAEALDDLRITARIERRAGDDRLEERRIYASRARECREESSGAQQLEREQVDVFVGTRGVLRLRRGWCEFRRIEHHEVEVRAAVAQRAQMREGIGLHE